jgi:DNA invertase Pin-like site-specific DNA recombinase
MNVVAYLRLSKKGAGEGAGLGLDAQREYITAAARQNGWTIIAEYTDVSVSGGVALEERPEGSKAVALAKQEGATLLAAKLDRIGRDVEHIARLMKRVQFKVATMPNADSFQLHLFAALAEQERSFIRQRTKDALAALKHRAEAGDSVSVAKVARRAEALAKGRTEVHRDAAQEAIAARVSAFHKGLEPHLHACLYRGLKSLRQVAECLNDRGVLTSKGGTWSATQVARAMSVLQLEFIK